MATLITQRYCVVLFVLLWLMAYRANTIDYLSSLCDGTIYAYSPDGFVDSQRGLSYGHDLDCRVTISANASLRILLTFLTVDIEGDGHDCQNADYLQVYDGSSEFSALGPSICGSRKPADITSTSSSITLVFRTDSSETGRGFFVAYTLFADPFLGSCGAGEFQCDNDRCIDASLRYNGYDNCGDNSDERKPARDTKNNTESDTGSPSQLDGGIIAVIVVCSIIGLSLVIGISLCICFNDRCKDCPSPQNVDVNVSYAGADDCDCNCDCD